MTDTNPIDLGSVPDSAVRSVAADLVDNGGLPIDHANQTLVARGLQPLPDSPAMRAKLALDQLKRDPKTVWDAATMAKAAILGMSARDAGKLTDAPSAGDYFFAPIHAADWPKDSAISKDELHTGLQGLAADLALSKPDAQALANFALEAVQRESQQTPEQREEYGANQERILLSVLKADEGQMKVLQETIRTATGRDLDLLRIARSNGADMALRILWGSTGQIEGEGQRVSVDITRQECITQKVPTAYATHYVHLSHVDGRVTGRAISSPGKFDSTSLTDMLRAIADAANDALRECVAGIEQADSA